MKRRDHEPGLEGFNSGRGGIRTDRNLGRRLLAAIVALVVAFAASSFGTHSSASGPGEVAFSTLEMSPLGGKLFKEVRKPVDWRVKVEITAPWPEVAKVRPVKKIRAAFPAEMEFFPAKDLDVCPDELLNPGSGTLGIPVADMIRKCPGSLIGNGRARLYLAKNNGPNGTNLNNSELAIFYGGLDRNRTPRLKVYGFDAQVATGVYMEGTWTNNVLDVEIPQLPFDTSTGYFELAIPGSNTGFPDRIGKDQGFVRASCAKGFWVGTSEFLLGERDSSGLPFGEEVLIRAPDFRADCVGLDGSPSLELTSPGESRNVKARSVIKAIVTNSGTATARNVRIRVKGQGVKGGSAIPPISKLAPGASRSVKTRVSFSRKGRAKLRITASGSGLKTVSLSRVVRVG